jgi:hypothetical protein
MKNWTQEQRPLLDPWFAWKELPDAVRQQTLDVLTAIYLATVDSPDSETQTDDSSAS